MILFGDSLSVATKTFTTPNILGWVFNSIICILLTVIFYPYLEDRFQAFVVRRLNFLKFTSKHKIAGKWTHTWHVTSKSFPAENVIEHVEIKQFGRKIFAQYNVIDNKSKVFTYQMLGHVDKDQVITGIWRDIEKGNRYHGCFQIYIDINEQTMHGYWSGLSNEKDIKSDKWEWIRE